LKETSPLIKTYKLYSDIKYVILDPTSKRELTFPFQSPHLRENVTRVENVKTLNLLPAKNLSLYTRNINLYLDSHAFS